MKIEKIKYTDYTEWVYQKGSGYVLHREDGPAREWNNGNKIWYYHGKLHREDGPAFERSNGIKEWYYHGIRAKDKKEFYSKEFRNKALLGLVK